MHGVTIGVEYPTRFAGTPLRKRFEACKHNSVATCRMIEHGDRYIIVEERHGPVRLCLLCGGLGRDGLWIKPRPAGGG